jgi:hypothetical protein
MVMAGLNIDKYWLSEFDEEAREIGDNIIRRVKHQYAPQLRREFDTNISTLPQDITKITEDMIVALGRIDLFSAAWPCTDLSGASRDEARGLDGDRSALFFKVEQVLFWVRKHNPHCEFFCENVVFNEKFPNAWNLVNSSLGPPVVFDAALVSLAHRLRAYWSSFFRKEHVPDLNMSITLSDALHPDHGPIRSLYTDRPPFARCNTAGYPMTRYVTVVRYYETHSIRSGAGLVRDLLTGLPVRPYLEEIEGILGYQPGDTMTEKLARMPQWRSDMTRWGVLGNVIDVRALTHIFTHLPAFPVF